MGEAICPRVREIASSIDMGALSQEDCYALYWIARNELYKKNHGDQRVLLVKYERLLSHSNEVSRNIYKHLGLKYRGWYSSLIGKKTREYRGLDLRLHPAIEECCQLVGLEMDKYECSQD